MFFMVELIAVILQVVTFIPFYLVWRKDCKEIGKDNLAVSLRERFTAYVVCVPLWFVPILLAIKGIAD